VSRAIISSHGIRLTPADIARSALGYPATVPSTGDRACTRSALPRGRPILEMRWRCG
jgi:hypothetical protein